MSYKRYSPSSGEKQTFGNQPIGMIFQKKEDFGKFNNIPQFVKTDDNYAVCLFIINGHYQNGGFVHLRSEVSVVFLHMMKEDDYEKLFQED